MDALRPLGILRTQAWDPGSRAAVIMIIAVAEEPLGAGGRTRSGDYRCTCNLRGRRRPALDGSLIVQK